MIMYISLYDIGLLIAFAIIIVVCSYLIAVLHRTFCVLGYAREILGDHDEEIRQTISGLPSALANVNELAISLKATVDQIGSLQDNVTDTVDDLRDGMENIIVYGRVVAEIFQSIFSKTK